ncbi:MAG: hypothetical protein ACYC2E_15495 [Sulfuricella sp.]
MRGLIKGNVIFQDPFAPDDIEAAVEAHLRELSEPAATLYAVQKIHGNEVREQTKCAYGRLVDAHLLITGVLATGLLRVNGKIVPFIATNEERSSLFANYVIGMVVCERAIEGSSGESYGEKR